MRWAVADPYHRIERAQLVVVDISDDAERNSANPCWPRSAGFAGVVS
jgi:hypothetical protein